MERKKIRKAIRGDEGLSVLSALPDSILVYILSLLQTKDAVRTSILSTRWKHLWASVPNLNFILPHEIDETSLHNFMNFVDRVLHLHDLQFIQTFSIMAGRRGAQIDLNRFNAWIGALIKRRVLEIHLDYDQIPKLPSSLFTCESLVVLSVSQWLVIDLPGSVYLPKLKTLRISFRSPNENVTRRLFRSCPVLEELYIFSDLGVKRDTIFDICAPMLKTLDTHVFVTGFDPDEYEIRFLVDAPNLESLSVRDDCFAHYSLKNQSALVSAQILVGEDLHPKYMNAHYGKRVVELLTAISDVRSLQLYGETTSALNCIDGGGTSTLRNVTCLKLRVSCLSRFPDVLHMMPCLEFLRANISYPGDEDGDEREMMELHAVPTLEEMQMQAVPRCLSSCLREIEVCFYKGWKVEQLFVKYLLQNSKVLKKLHFESFECKVKEIEKVIQETPRCSETCEIVVGMPLQKGWL